MAAGSEEGKPLQGRPDADATSEVAYGEKPHGNPAEPSQAAFPPTFSVSEIKNKQRRHFMFLRWKQQQKKVRRKGSQSFESLSRLSPSLLISKEGGWLVVV